MTDSQADRRVTVELTDEDEETLTSSDALLEFCEAEQAALRFYSLAWSSMLKPGMNLRFCRWQQGEIECIAGKITSLEQVSEEPVRVRVTQLQRSILANRRVMPRYSVEFPVSLSWNVDGSVKEVIGVCFDIGAGGMRVRAPKQELWPQLFHISFELTSPKIREFLLTGKLLRVSEVARDELINEIAVRFEGLTVDERMTLAFYFTQ